MRADQMPRNSQRDGSPHGVSKSAVKRVVMRYHPSITGCTDGNCIFQDNSKGMHTNGGCQCEKVLRRHPEGLKAIRTILFLREQLRKAGA